MTSEAYAATSYPSPLWGGWRARRSAKREGVASRVGVAASAFGPLPPPPGRSHSLAATLPLKGRVEER